MLYYIASHSVLRLFSVYHKMILFRSQHVSTKIAFKITRQQANQKFTQVNTLLESAPLSFDSTNRLVVSKKDPINQCYLPFYTADIRNLQSKYTGEYGIDRYVTTYMPIYNGKTTTFVPIITTVTDWYSISGTLHATHYPIGTPTTQVYADFLYPRHIIEKSLNSEQLPDMLQEKAISSHLTYPHHMKGEFAMAKITSRVYKLETLRALDYIRSYHRADRSRLSSLKLNLHQAKINLIDYHVPTYIWEMDSPSFLGQHRALKIIHGQSGNYEGEKRLSPFRTALLGTVLGGIGMIGVRVLGGPLLSSLHLVGTLIASGLSSGFVIQFYNSVKNIGNERQLVDDVKLNQEYQETQEDRNRRQQIEKENHACNHETILQNHIRLPIDECRVLNLDPSTHLVTLQMVQEAYHTEIKKWHPDIYDGDQKVAQSMSIQINHAYTQLSQLLNHSRTLDPDSSARTQ